MIRLILLAAALSAGCAEIECEGTGAAATCTNDDRPATIEYVTTTILRPYCANAQCHSSFHAEFGYRFDTVEHLNESSFLVVPGDPDASLLFNVLIRDNIDGEFPRMPYDQPLPAPEIALVKRWIAEGADGLVVQ